jgi:hypothetical protein
MVKGSVSVDTTLFTLPTYAQGKVGLNIYIPVVHIRSRVGKKREATWMFPNWEFAVISCARASHLYRRRLTQSTIKHNEG